MNVAIEIHVDMVKVVLDSWRSPAHGRVLGETLSHKRRVHNAPFAGRRASGRVWHRNEAVRVVLLQPFLKAGDSHVVPFFNLINHALFATRLSFNLENEEL
jgi:hypothetical protein